MPGRSRISSHLRSRLARGCDGTVHGVFSKGMNVELDDGFLVYLGSRRQSLCCFGMQLDGEVLDGLLSAARTGDAVRLSLGGVSFAREGIGYETVDLAGAVMVDTALKAPLDVPARVELARFVESLDLAENLGIEVDAHLLGALRGLRGDAASQERAIGFLLGRGKGLTPAGDDILAGYGLGLRVRGESGTFPWVLARAMERTATTDVSVAYLRAMLAGCANENYLDLVEAARRGSRGRYAMIAASIRSVGHTSGNDSLFGFSQALNTYNRLSVGMGDTTKELCLTC